MALNNFQGFFLYHCTKVKVIKNPYIFILGLLLGLSSAAQSIKLEYLPKNADSLKAFVSSLVVRKAKEFGPEHQKKIQEALDERRDHFLKTITDSSYIYNSELNNYLKKVLAKIYAGNPQIRHDQFYFFIDRSPVPNAGCFGNGIFTVNLGLFAFLESEDQLASVLCHEIAHYELKHNDKSMLRHIQTLNYKDTKKKISQIKGQRYGRRQALIQLQKELGYNFMKRSRTAEMEADSLGLTLFAKAGFDKAGAIGSLKKLKESDSLLFSTNTNLRSRFNFDTYPFKEGWLEPETKLFEIKEMADDMALDKDSLKSHPNIDKRLEKLFRLSRISDAHDTPGSYHDIRNLAGLYMIQSAMDGSRLDIALYQALSMAESGKLDEQVYGKTVASLLKRTYDLKQSHKFGKYVSPVSPFSEEINLNELRLFLNRLELKNIRKIGHYFCQKYRDQIKNDPEFEQITAYFQALNPN